MYALYPVAKDFKYFVDNFVDQEEVFSSYGGFPVNESFSSPFRKDNNPSCRLYKGNNQKIYIIDDTTKSSYDFIETVQEFERLSFMDTLELILDRYLFKYETIRIPEEAVESMKRVKEHSYAQFKVSSKKWSTKELKYWTDLGVSFETLQKFNVFLAQTIIVKETVVYNAGPMSTVFIYKLGKGTYQFYFPFSPKGKRFLCNTNKILGWEQLPPEGKLLVITKSMKDVIVLHEMGYTAIAPIGEGSIIDEDTINILKFKFDEIVIFNDFDLTGISSSIYYDLEYDIQARYLTNGLFGTTNYKAKDPADLVKLVGFKKAKQEIDTLLVW